jgi:hypothetical protein
MDIGYVILLLLILVHACAAVFLYLRAREAPSGLEEAWGVPVEEAQDEPPETEEAVASEGLPPGNGGQQERPSEGPSG